MARFAEGLRESIACGIGGFVLSGFISGFIQNNPDVMAVKGAFNILSVLGIIETIENSHLWGISYMLGYMTGVSWFGIFFYEPLEIGSMFLIFIAYLYYKFS